eukprot:353378-Chlamydomonas_euryale.AAC.3
MAPAGPLRAAAPGSLQQAVDEPEPSACPPQAQAETETSCFATLLQATPGSHKGRVVPLARCGRLRPQMGGGF